MKKRFIVEIEIPENTGDLCWDQDKTGLQAFHDCIAVALPQVNLEWLHIAKEVGAECQEHIKMKNAVRNSFKVIKPAGADQHES